MKYYNEFVPYSKDIIKSKDIDYKQNINADMEDILTVAVASIISITGMVGMLVERIIDKIQE